MRQTAASGTAVPGAKYYKSAALAPTAERQNFKTSRYNRHAQGPLPLALALFMSEVLKRNSGVCSRVGEPPCILAVLTMFRGFYIASFRRISRVGLVNARAHFGMKENAGTTVAEILKAFWAFLGIASPVCSGFKSKSHFSGVARSTYVGSPFRITSRVGGGVELKKNCHFRSN